MIQRYHTFSTILFENDNVIIKELSDDSYEYGIHEGFSYKKYYKDDGSSLELFPGDKEVLEYKELKLRKYLENINPFEGHYFLSKQETILTYNFRISTTERFITKFLREKYENPVGKYRNYNPQLLEGVQLVYNNRNNLTDIIFNKRTKDGRVMLTTKDSSMYTVIVGINQRNVKGYKHFYELTLISQLKGSPMKNTIQTPLIGVLPDGQPLHKSKKPF